MVAQTLKAILRIPKVVFVGIFAGNAIGGYIYICIERERERELYAYIYIYTYTHSIYIYIYIHIIYSPLGGPLGDGYGRRLPLLIRLSYTI